MRVHPWSGLHPWTTGSQAPRHALPSGSLLDCPQPRLRPHRQLSGRLGWPLGGLLWCRTRYSELSWARARSLFIGPNPVVFLKSIWWVNDSTAFDGSSLWKLRPRNRSRSNSTDRNVSFDMWPVAVFNLTAPTSTKTVATGRR